MLTVRDIMTTKVITIHKDKPVCEVEGLFIEHEISGAPIVDDKGDVTGVISKSDVIRFVFTGGDTNYASAWEIASPIVITTEASISIQEAASIMIDKHIHRLLVMDGKTMVGMLSAHDLVKLVAEQAE